MEYKILYANDNNTVKVQMIIDGHILEQDFATDNLDDNVRNGLAVFKTELDNRPVPVALAPQEDVIRTVDPKEIETLQQDNSADYLPEEV